MPSVQSVSLSHLRGLTGAEVSRLKKAGIDSTTELLAAAPTTAKERALAKKAGMSFDRMREAVNRADLVRVPGIGPALADLFENAGVNSARELAMRNPKSVAVTVDQFVRSNPALNYRGVSASTVATLVTKAKQTVSDAGPGQPTPTVVAKHLKMAVVRFYVRNQSDFPAGSPTGFEAQTNMSTANLSEVTDPADDPHGHDLAKFRVFSHPDTIFVGSDIRWYAVFERDTGKFVETYQFN